ncbi:MAG: hypothetical protein ABIP93_16910, partial [Gemmatimonadaceae bacterium]
MQEHLAARGLAIVALVAAAATAAACGQSSDDTRVADSVRAEVRSVAADSARPAAQKAYDTLPALATVPDIKAGGECPDPSPSAAADITAQASAIIPLKVGLTLSHMWKGYEGDYEHECLAQVVAVDARGVVVTGSCPMGAKGERVTAT